MKKRATRTIESLDDIAAGVRALKRKCPLIRQAHALAGDPPLRREPGGFRGMAEIVVGQMLSLASAAAIWGRLEKVVEPFAPHAFLALGDDALMAAGLSRPKIKALRAIAEAELSGAFDFARLEHLAAEEARSALLALPGIGPWSADIYLMFCLGHRDAFAPGDLALQIAAERLMELDERPGPSALEAIAERWRPWRGVAARQLWAYYRTIKRLERE
jgi:DNA-3-methyladenine glycosylase II